MVVEFNSSATTSKTNNGPSFGVAQTLFNIMKFHLGQVVVTKTAQSTFTMFELLQCLHRHIRCDWGTLVREDKLANNRALKTGDRILSSYVIRGKKLWIITDAEDDNGVRAYTTLLLPSDY